MPQSIHPIHEPIHATLTLPGSRSITHRALLLAALAEGVSELSGLHLGADTHILIQALQQLGIVIQLDKKARSCIVAGGNGKFPKKQATLWCGSAKTIVQYLISATALTPGVYYFDGTTRLHAHPLAPLLNILLRQGAQIIPNETRQLPFTLVGSDTLEGGEIQLDYAPSSQLISALLMIAPFARSAFQLSRANVAYQPPIEMTCAMMAEFGVLVHKVHQGQFIVPVPQRYQARDYIIEPNLSLAAYFFAAAAITQGDVTIQPLKRFSAKQTDIAFLSVLEKMGCQVLETHKGLTVKGPALLEGGDIDSKDCPHSLLALAAAAPFARSPVRLSHLDKIGRPTRQRLNQFKDILLSLKVRIETGDDWLTIFPSTPQGKCVNTEGDAYLAMATAVIGLKCNGVILDETSAITKRYPDFLNQWQRLAESCETPV